MNNNQSLNTPPGVSDVFFKELNRKHYVKKIIDKVFKLYGYNEIEIPILEYSDIFKRNIGYQNEVIKKEMYTFLDQGDRELALRPEGTAGTMRALAKANILNDVKMNRVYYYGPMFRSDKPAAGRKRQFNQVGVENVCNPNPYQDAECIIMLAQYIKELKITDGQLLINSKGSSEDMIHIANDMQKYFSKHIKYMCDDCKHRLQNNVLRILDCKEDQCNEIINKSPNIYELLSTKSKKYFNKVIDILNENDIKYTINPRLIRGLDYYEHTIYEIQHDIMGKIDSIVGGGRYKIRFNNIKDDIYGVGFAAGIERLVLAQDSCNAKININYKKPIFIITPTNSSENTKKYNFKLAQLMRSNNIFTIIDFYENNSLKSQMRLSNKFNSKQVIIIGDQEFNNKNAIIKDMKTGKQMTITEKNLLQTLKIKKYVN